MHLGMTVEACIREQELRRPPGRQVLCHLRQAAMPHRRMAFLTKLRRSSGKQGGLVRAVGHVADHAVLGRRRMLPQERPSFLGMAGDARFVDAVAQGQRLADPTVWVVAIATNQLAVAHRMRRALESVRQHVAVAASTYLRLFGGHSHRIGLGMDAVAVATREIRLLVRAPRPMHALVGFMASEAKPVLKRRLRIPPHSEIQHRFATGFVAQHSSSVFAGRAVARLALQPARCGNRARHLERRVWHGRMSMHSGEDGKRRERFLFVVTAEAAVSTATGIVAFRQLLREFVMCVAKNLLACGNCHYPHHCQREGKPRCRPPKRLPNATLPLNDAVPPKRGRVARSRKTDTQCQQRRTSAQARFDERRTSRRSAS